VLGTASYTLAQAQAATIPALPPSISACAILVGKIIVQKNATTATEISSAFAASYSAASLSNHADLLNLDYANSGHTGFQPTLVSGTSIKTVNNASLLGSGDLAVQPTLVSGTNIKTVNNASLLGSGNILAGHTIKDEGSVLTTRTNLNFVGSAVTVTDDSSNDATVVTISSGAISDGDKGDITVSGNGTVWTVDTISPDKGGTGVVNSANNTITFTGNYPLGITLASSTSIALPATGTLATLAGTETLTNKTLTSPTFTGTPTAPTAAARTNSNQIATTAYVDGTMVLRTSVQTTSGTAIDFTGIPNWVKRISVFFNQVSTNGSSALILQIGCSANGIETSGYIGTYETITGSSGVAGNFSSSFQLENGTGASYTMNGMLFLLLMDANNTWTESATMGHGGEAYIRLSGGVKTLGGVLDRIRITTANGSDTFDNGSINIMYEG
jgi:hypothetical protein